MNYLQVGELNYIYKFTLQPSYNEIMLHTHDWYEILHFISGRAELQLEKQKIMLTPDTLVLIPAGQLHRVNIIESCPFERSVINFMRLPIGLGEHLFEQVRLVPVESPMREALERMHRYGERPPLEERRERLLEAVLIELLILLENAVWMPANRQGQFMEQVLAYIDRHLTRISGVEELCREMHVSRAYLYREFDAALGQSPARYIAEKRLQLAHRRLQLGEGAARVAEVCGWRDYSAFYRAYRARFGHSPTKPMPSNVS